jgi:hypothetical protein
MTMTSSTLASVSKGKIRIALNVSTSALPLLEELSALTDDWTTPSTNRTTPTVELRKYWSFGSP